tara:strand:+ start:478 stop:642 length:165 start_codon:yes stop_codon:yes gene_type:complete
MKLNIRGRKTEVVAIRISVGMKKALEELAEENQGTIGQVVRLAIVDYLKAKFPE